MPRKTVSLCFLSLAIACCGCAGRNAPTTPSGAQAQKIEELEKRLATLEEKTANLDAISRGVDLLLEKLDGMSGNRRQGPNPTEVYSVPIDGDPYIGPKFAKVTMVKGYDFYCGFCDKVRPVLGELRSQYGDDLKIVFKNFVIHDEVARLPALAACAAHQQGKFAEMFDAIWVQGLRARKELLEEDLQGIASELKLNKKKFQSDMRGPCQDKVQSDFESLAAVGASGTPAFYINGRFIAGALPIDKYRAIIDEELAKANRALDAGADLAGYYQGLVESGKKSL